MITSYGGKNCWAFKEWMVVNLKINKNVPSEFGFDDVRVVPAICFEGANASGKSCSLKVLSFIYDFCLNSFNYQSDAAILYDAHFNNKDAAEFFLSFYIGDDFSKEYTYECKLSQTKVIFEKLFYEENKKKHYVIRRTKNSITECAFKTNIDNIILRDNVSVISTFVQYGVPEIQPVKEFLSNIRSNVAYWGTLETQLTDYVAEFYYNNPSMHRRVVEELKKFDTGIEDVEIVPGMDANGKNTFFSLFHHKTDETRNNLSYFSQSTGTKLLYNRLMEFYITIENGGVLVFDEIEMHLHARIVPLLLDYFLNQEINKKHAQIIFTAHNAEILDIMKKYRTYLFNKENGESYCYRIDELPDNILIRNDRSLEAVYKTGDIGGVPNVKTY